MVNIINGLLTFIDTAKIIGYIYPPKRFHLYVKRKNPQRLGIFLFQCSAENNRSTVAIL